MTAPEAFSPARTIRGPVRLLAAAALAAAAAACVSAPPRSSLTRSASEPPRVRAARERQEAALRSLFARARVEEGAPLALVVFKEERRLEVRGWSRRGGRYVTIASYPLLATSGELGPKRRAWDHQIPEGFYRVAALNPASLYHLSLLVDYPNASDRRLGDPRDPGDEIYIHGDHVSDGCLAVGDHAIEQVYLAVQDARAAGHEVPVAIFPCRFSDGRCRALLHERSEGRPALAAFWANLAQGYEALERTGRPPRVGVAASGRYVYADAAGAAGSR